MKTFNKIVVMFLVMMIGIMGTSFADTTPPTFTPDIPSGSIVEPGERVTITIKTMDKYTAIEECTYSWNNTATKNIFDTSTLRGEEGNKHTIEFTFEAFSKTPGLNILKIYAKDSNGKEAKKEFRYTVEDNEAPTITSDVKNKATVEPGSEVNVTITDNYEIAEIKYRWNNEAYKYILKEGSSSKHYNKYTYTLEEFPKTNDTLVLDIVATDFDGNSNSKTYTYYVRYEDNTKPVITMSKKSGSVVEPGTKLTMQIVDEESKITSLKYNWEGSKEKDLIPSIKEPANRCTITNLTIGSAAGTYRLHVTAVNAFGKKTQETFEYIVEAKDSDSPEIEAIPGYGIIETESTISLMVTDNEGLKTLKYKWSNGKTITKTISGKRDLVEAVAPSEEGKYTLYVEVIDEADNTTSDTFTYTIEDEEDEKDEEKPTVTAKPNSGSKIDEGEKIVLTAKDNEELKSLTYKWDNGTEKSATIAGTVDYVTVTAPNEDGEHTLYVTVTDKAGNVDKESFEYTIEDEAIDTNEKPTVSVSPDGGNAKPGEDVEIKGKDKEGLDTIIYNWDDEDPIKKVVSGKEAIVNTDVPVEPGKHILYVTVEDEDGNKVTDSFSFTVSDDENPTITMNPESGTTVKGGKVVKATLKDNVELKEVTYNWDDEDEETVSLDGTSETISLPKLPYEEGTYKVTITVEDNAGNKTTGKYTYYVEEDEDEGEYPTVDADPDGGDVEYGDKITITAEDEDGEIEYVEYYWDDDDDDTKKKYDDEFTVKVPSEEGKHYLYVRAMDDDDNLCDYERFTYNVEENNYPGNSDIVGDVNSRVKALRVEIRNADDKIRFEPDEEILYYVDYYNGSSSDVKNAKLVVDLPTYLEGEEASDDGKVSSKKVTWELGTLESGEYGRVSFVAKYTNSKSNEKIITVPAKIYSGSSLKDTSTVRNMIFCEGASGTGNHKAYCVGYPNGTFLAEGKITRAELASMISNIEGISGTHRGQFTDANNHWAANYMQAVVDKGYMIPKSYNRFGAQDYATRADLAYAIAAILDVHDLEPIFISATDTKNSDARCAIEQLLRLGIMDGYSDGTAKPNSNITRAEAVTIFNNYLFRGELNTKGYNYAYNFEKNYNHGGSNYILRFTDLSANHWAYGHIMEATNNHKYERVMDGNEDML